MNIFKETDANVRTPYKRNLDVQKKSDNKWINEKNENFF